VTSRQTITFPDRYYVISPDPRLRAGRITQAIVMAQFQDEHTALAPTAALNAFSSFPRLTARSTTEGIAGLTGIPERALPKLRTDPYDVDFRVTARRYLPFLTTVHFVNQNSFPDIFSPRDLGLVTLHRESVDLFGRVVRATATGNVPASGVNVSITGYWLLIPTPASAPPATPPNLVSLQPGVFLNRSAASARIRRRDFTVTPDVSELLDDAPAGLASLRLSNRVGLAPGEILRIDPGDPGRTEYLIVLTATGSSDPTQPAQVTLRYPGRVAHRPGGRVERVTAAAPGANNNLISDAIPGDAVVLSSALTGIAGATTIEIDDGGPDPEYHTVSLFSVATDAGGFYRLPALNRVGQLELTADDGVNPPVRRIIVPDYELAENLVDIVLS
jgi:hypothetical protein